MIQYRIFVDTIAEIEAAFNAWAAGLVTGANINSGPLTRDGEQWFKEVMFVLPTRANGAIAVPQIARANGRQ